MDLTNHPYFNNPYLSYSGLNKLLFSPVLFKKHYLEDDREEKLEPHLIEGKLVHLLLLEEENLLKNFVVSPSKTPTDNVAKLLFHIHINLDDEASDNLADHESLILQTLIDRNLYQSFKEDSKRLDKVLTHESLEYFKYLRNSKGKDVVDQDTFDKCKGYAEILKNAPGVSDLLRKSDNNFNYSSESEIFVDADMPDYPFNIRGFIDNLVIDHNNKRVVINDVKTTGKTIKEFPDTVKYYNYDLQAGMYSIMALQRAPEYQNYELEFNFIVIDKYQQVCIFSFDDSKVRGLMDAAYAELDKAKWHFDNRNFDLPYELKEGRVYL